MKKWIIILIGCLLLVVSTAQSHVIGMRIIFEHGWQRNQRTLLTVGFALLLAIVVCFYRRREHRRQRTGYQCREETLQMERQVENPEKSILHQQELDILKKRIAMLRLKCFESTSSYQLLRVLERRRAEQKSLEAPVMSPAEREVLFHLLDELFDDFMKDLKGECPLLTRDDLLFCCLVSLHLPLSAIAICFGYSDANVLRQRKYRMKDRILKSSDGLEVWERLFGEVKD